MATTTPNFGWPVPTSTDLVKDGATAMEALGDAIDTSMVDLKGGTTGQVLSKASSADMDFVWVTNADGDITGVTAGTGLTGGGTSGTVSLTVDPTYAGFTNLNYIANPLLNSAFNVWQRGTSIAVAASSNPYTCDRWKMSLSSGASYTVSRQATGDTTNLPNIQYAARVQRDNGQTGVNANYFIQGIETVNSIPYAGKTITTSFYARKGANYSATSNLLSFIVAEGTGTDQDPAGAYTGQNNIFQLNATLTSTWQRFTITGNVASTSTELKAFFTYTPTGTASTNDYYEVTGVQVDVGSVALPFRTNGPTYEAELAACQRYYYRFGGDQTTQPYGLGYGTSATTALITVYHPVPMRVAPSLTDYALLWVVDHATTTAVTSMGVPGNWSGKNCTAINAVVASGLTTNRPYNLIAQGTLSSYVGFSAEL